MTPNEQRIVAIFGSYSAKPGEPQYEQAYQIGLGLARAGFVVCNGGYGGTMLASARGAKAVGGRTIGVTCSLFTDASGQPLQPNPHIDEEIAHDDLLRRIEAMMRMACGYVVLEGGTGTLAEFAIVWEFVCKGLVRRRPIVVVGEFWRPVVESIRRSRPEHAAMVTLACEPADVVTAIASNGTPRV
ncbi:MAG: LOG family protein [Phycisphaerae bacterium]|nr:LOG family protein [Phycisphaerae bacterium]